MFFILIITLFGFIAALCVYRLLIALTKFVRDIKISKNKELVDTEKYGTKSLKQIVDSLNVKSGKVILLNGPWGSGKTWIWNNYIKSRLKRRKVIYVSLFGKSDVHADVFESIVDNLPHFRIDTLKTKIGYFILSWLIMSILVFVGLHALPNDLPPDNLLFFNKCFIPEMLHFLQKYQNMILSIECGFLLTFSFRKHLLGFFAEKYLGVKCDNINYKNFICPNDFVICFDDLERMISDLNDSILTVRYKNRGLPYHNVESFLAFCDTLREQGFSILVICNADEVDGDILSRYKEKVITRSFSYEVQEENLNNILLESKLSREEQRFIKELLLNLIAYLPNAYNSNEKNMTQKLINLRFVIALIDTLKMLKQSKLYKKAEKQYILFPAVALHCALRHLDKDSFDSDSVNRKPSLARVFGLLYYNSTPEELSRFIDDGTEGPNLRKILSINQYTAIEKTLLNVSLWDLSTKQLRALLTKINKLIKNQSKVFSSVKNMQNFLRTYVYVLTECGESFDGADVVWQSVRNFLEIQSIEVYIKILFESFGERFIEELNAVDEQRRNILFINNKIEDFCLDKLCERVIKKYSIETLFDRTSNYHNDKDINMIMKYIAFCYLSSNSKQIDMVIKSMKDNYQLRSNWSQAMISIAQYPISNQKIIHKYFKLDSLYPFNRLFKQLDILLLRIEKTSKDNREKKLSAQIHANISGFISQE